MAYVVLLVKCVVFGIIVLGHYRRGSVANLAQCAVTSMLYGAIMNASVMIDSLHLQAVSKSDLGVL